MKKTISILLSLLLVMSLPFSLPLGANAAGYKLTLKLDAGKQDDLWLVYDTIKYPDLNNLPAGTIFEFKVALHNKYDPNHTSIYANNQKQIPTADGLYGVLMDQDIEITCPSNGGQNFILKTFIFDTVQARGDGYIVYPEISINERIAPAWGESVIFRVILKDGYGESYNLSDPAKSRLLVKIYNMETGGTIDLDNVANVTKVTTKTVYDEKAPNIDEQGRHYKTVVTEVYYKVDNITANMSVSVLGVSADATVNGLNLFTRVIRLLINLFTGNAAAADFDGIITDSGIIDAILRVFSAFAKM